MLKKTTLAIAAAAAIAMSVASPSTASAKGLHLNFGIYGPGHVFGVHSPYYGHRYYNPYRFRRCHYHTRKVWTKHGPRWRKIRHCRSHNRRHW